MDSAYKLMIAFPCIYLFLITIWKFLNFTWFLPKKMEKTLRAQGFMGETYRFLLVGPRMGFDHGDQVFQQECSRPLNLHDDDIVSKVLRMNPEKIRKSRRNYVWFGAVPALIIRDPELIKEVTLKPFQFLRVKFDNPLAELMTKGISSLNKKQWSKHRKIMSPAFHIEKIKLMIPAFRASVDEIVTKWEEILSSKSGTAEIDVWPDLRKLTSDVISRTAFGSNYEEGRIIFELQQEQSEYYSQVLSSVYIPGWKFLPTKRNRRMKEICGIVNHKIRCLVEARMKAMKAGEACADDLLGLLLKSNIEEMDEQRGGDSGGSNKEEDVGMSIQDVIEECKLLYVAGQDTTSVLLVWTMILLARHPEWQHRARQEVLQIFHNDQITNANALNELKIVTMILQEALRLYTPAGTIIRIAGEEAKLGNMTVPKGAYLLLYILLLHHDPEYWGDDANEFKPDRFAGGVSTAAKDGGGGGGGGQYSYFPFSWGPRICLGQNFVMTEARMTIAMILQRFSFEIAPSYSHLPYCSPLTTTHPKHGAQLIFHKL